MSNMFTFPKEKRIRKGNDYKRLFSQGKRVVGKHCRVYSLVGLDQGQMGVVISRKIKGAVRRNHHKRLIREYYRINQFKLKAHTKLVIFVATCFQPACYEAIDKELTKLIEKAQLFTLQ